LIPDTSLIGCFPLRKALRFALMMIMMMMTTNKIVLQLTSRLPFTTQISLWMISLISWYPNWLGTFQATGATSKSWNFNPTATPKDVLIDDLCAGRMVLVQIVGPTVIVQCRQVHIDPFIKLLPGKRFLNDQFDLPPRKPVWS
jgi:hypothetical protein